MDEYIDICRSFSFVNLNIPPSMKDFSDRNDLFRCGYISIGFFDEMRTELLEGSPDRSALSSMWLCNERLALALDGTHSFQNIFGFRSVPNEDEDKKFWAEETDRRYPLTFVTFLQMQPEKVERSTVREQLDAIEAVLRAQAGESKGSYIFSCYVTLDKNDFVICIKSKKYSCIARSILALHNNLKPRILYSYSVMSLNRRWMKDLAENESLFPVDGGRDELIDSICLKGITNSVTDGAFESKYRELCRQLDSFLYGDDKSSGDDESGGHDSQLYDILGDYDFRYIARDVPMKRLLLAIAREDGPLNYRSRLFKFALFSSNLVLNIRSGGVGTDNKPFRNVSEYPGTQDEDTLERSEKRMKRDFGDPLCRELMEQLSEHRDRLCGELSSSGGYSLKRTAYWANMASLWKLLSSLSALEKAPTRKYDFHSLYWPYRMLISMLGEENYFSDQEHRMPDEDMYGFIHGLSSTLHGTLRTDIQFFQINDFNAIVHYAPAKLRAFYSAWTYELTQCYRRIHVGDAQDLEREYEFVTVPNTNSVIRTFEFNPYRRMQGAVGTKRLMRIEIPERYLYQPRETCIHLAHETAHFVGTGIRCRPARHMKFISIISAMIAGQYCTDICSCLVECGRAELAGLFKQFLAEEQEVLYADIRDDLQTAVDAVSAVCGAQDIRKDEHIRSSVFISYVTTALQMILDRPAYSIEQFKEGRRSERSKVAYRIQYLCANFRFYASSRWKGNAEELRAGLIDFVRIGEDISGSQYSRRFAQFLSRTGPSGILQMPMNLIKETQADVVSVLMLRITPFEYFQSFFQSGLTYEIRSAKDIGIILKFRLLFVLSALRAASGKQELRFLKEKGWDRPFSALESRSVAAQSGIETAMQAIRDLSGKINPLLCSDMEVLPVRAKAFEQPNEKSVRSSTCGYFMLCSEFTARGILDYLDECISAMAPELNDADMRKISEIYQRICSKSILDLVEEIDKTLFGYERKRSGRQPCGESA